MTVTGTNTAPVAGADTATTAEDTPVTVDVLVNDSDVDGNPLTVTAATAGNGSVVINADGTLTYTPNANFNGTDTVTYTVSDGVGGVVTGTLTITVTAVNDAPVTGNDSATTAEDTPVTVNVLANDSDVDGNPLTVTAATAGNGSVVINADGTLTYTPNANFNGTDTVTYTVSDGAGGVVTGTLTITVTAVNDAPVAGADTATTAEDTPVTVDVLANDADVDGNPLTVTAATAGNGTVVINADGTLTYTPNANFNGTDTVTYTVSDGAGGVATGTLTITVTAVNDAPEVIGETTLTTSANTPVSVNVLDNSRDVDGDPLTVTSISVTNGRVLVSADGMMTYIPNPGFSGTDVVSYTLSDPQGSTVRGSLTVVVSALPGTDGNTAGGGTGQMNYVPPPDSAGLPPTFTPGRLSAEMEAREYDPILLDAVNAIKGLGGSAPLLGNQPGDQAIAGVKSLGTSSGLDLSQGSINQVVRDFEPTTTFEFLHDAQNQPVTNPATLGEGIPMGPETAQNNNTIIPAQDEPAVTVEQQLQTIAMRDQQALRDLIRALS
ncbi:Ig-like domain-containing protein [Dickeya fangzhongdai]